MHENHLFSTQPLYVSSLSDLPVVLDKLSAHITSRTAYVWGQTVFAVGTGCMAIFSTSIYATLALNATSGVMFAIVTTLPFGIVADYHQSYQVFMLNKQFQGHHRHLALDKKKTSLCAYAEQSNCMTTWKRKCIP